MKKLNKFDAATKAEAKELNQEKQTNADSLQSAKKDLNALNTLQATVIEVQAGYSKQQIKIEMSAEKATIKIRSNEGFPETVPDSTTNEEADAAVEYESTPTNSYSY